MIQYDTSELTKLSATLDRSARAAGPVVAKIVKRGAQNIRNDWVSRATGISYAPHYPRSITYDYLAWGVGARSDVGPDKDKTQGALGNILEYGTSNNPPRPDGAAALEAEAPKFLDALGVAAAGVL